MSCPDWRALCARREAGPTDGPSPRRGASEIEWRAALEHLDGCDDCQSEALAADPTLLFRRLPAIATGTEEVEAMQRAVASMRRGEKIEQRRPALRRSLLRVASLAAVILGSVLLRGAGEPLPSAEPIPIVEASPAAASELDLGWLPLIETIDPTYGSIIQVVDDDISLVVVLPSDADV